MLQRFLAAAAVRGIFPAREVPRLERAAGPVLDRPAVLAARGLRDGAPPLARDAAAPPDDLAALAADVAVPRRAGAVRAAADAARVLAAVLPFPAFSLPADAALP